MSKYSDYLKSKKKNDMDFFFGEGNWKMVSNQYYCYNSIIDNDNIIVWVNSHNIKLYCKNENESNASLILAINSNQAIYVKSFCLKDVEYWDEEKQTMYTATLVKLNRKYFKPYTFKEEFYSHENENSFDEFFEKAKRQAEYNLSVKNCKF